MFDSDGAFTNSNVNDMVDICMKTIQNKLSNFIPHQTIAIDDKDCPWCNTKKRLCFKIKVTFAKDFAKIV